MVQPDQYPAKWSPVKKLLFRFFFIFFLLYIFLNPNEIIPNFYYLHRLYFQPCNNFIEWLAKDALHLVNPAIRFYNGTIDTIFGYIVVLFIFLAAIFGSIIWSIAAKPATDYHKLYRILILVLRCYLAVTWIAYGSIKLIQLQFPSISPAMLLQTYGNSTPKDLAWAFMGYSAGYNLFIGVTECAVGLLLFFRRTSSLGNIIALGIFANVVVFNYSFDVNVKLLSTVFLAMTLFMLTTDFKRLINFFFLNKTIYPVAEQPPYFNKKWKNGALRMVKYLFIVYLIFFDLRGDMARAKKEGADPVKPPLYGIYNVMEFTRNKDTVKPLTTDTTRWNKLVVYAPKGNARIILMNDSIKDFTLQADTIRRTIMLSGKSDTSDKYVFIYSRPQKGMLLLTGKWRKDSLRIKLQEYDLNKFPLLKHGFRWIIDRNIKQ